MGFPSISYPRIHPTAQISISLEYGAPTSNSGGRYQRVATQSVSCSSFQLFFTPLAKPKSHIFSYFLSLMRRFSSLISRCMILRECRQASPLSSWQMRDRMSSGSSPSGDRSSTSSKLFCTYSKTRYTIPFLRKASLSSTILVCLTILSIFTSLTVVFLTTSSSSVSLNFFMAMISWLSLQRHFSTTPQAPSPITPKISYFCIAIIGWECKIKYHLRSDSRILVFQFTVKMMFGLREDVYYQCGISYFTRKVQGYLSTLTLESNLLSQQPLIFLSTTRDFYSTISSIPNSLFSQRSTSLAIDFSLSLSLTGTGSLTSFSLTILKISLLISRSQMQLQQFCRGKYLSSTTLTFSSYLSGYCSSLKLVNLLSLKIGSTLISLIQLEMQGSMLLLLLNKVSMWFFKSVLSALRLVRFIIISWEGSFLNSFLRRLQYPTACTVLSLGRMVVLMCSYSSGRFIVAFPYSLREYASCIIFTLMQDNRGTVWWEGQEVKGLHCLNKQLGAFVDIQWMVKEGKMNITSTKHQQFSYELSEGVERFNYVPFRHGANCPLLNQAIVKNGLRNTRPCSVVLLQDKENERFLGTQRPMNISFGGKWVLPGGHLQLGQSIIEGGIRECVEEVGLNKQSIVGIQHCDAMAWQSVYVVDSIVKTSGIVIFLHMQCKHFQVTPQVGQIQAFEWRKKDEGCPWGDGWAEGHLAYLRQVYGRE